MFFSLKNLSQCFLKDLFSKNYAYLSSNKFMSVGLTLNPIQPNFTFDRNRKRWCLLFEATKFLGEVDPVFKSNRVSL